AQIHLDRVRVRPAWSLSWLRGRPAFRIALRRGKADVDGTVRLGDRRGFAGRVSALPLDDLPLATWAPGRLLTGRLAAEIDGHARGGAPAAAVSGPAGAGYPSRAGGPVPRRPPRRWGPSAPPRWTGRSWPSPPRARSARRPWWRRRRSRSRRASRVALRRCAR